MHAGACRVDGGVVKRFDMRSDCSGVSNREIGEYAGINDQGQVSKLLARLEEHGLVENTSGNGFGRVENAR
jgi:DNA-binding MarR family transcriptional regulator